MAAMGATGAARFAMEIATRIENTLALILTELREIRQTEQGRKHFEVDFGSSIDGTVEGGKERTIHKRNVIPQGFEFRPERVVATAPKGCKLRIFKHNTDPSNLIEVVANIQEYADMTAGLTIEGTATLIAVVSGAEAEGPISVVMSGQLIVKRPNAPAQA